MKKWASGPRGDLNMGVIRVALSGGLFVGLLVQVTSKSTLHHKM